MGMGVSPDSVVNPAGRGNRIKLGGILGRRTGLLEVGRGKGGFTKDLN